MSKKCSICKENLAYNEKINYKGYCEDCFEDWQIDQKGKLFICDECGEKFNEVIMRDGIYCMECYLESIK